MPFANKLISFSFQIQQKLFKQWTSLEATRFLQPKKITKERKNIIFIARFQGVVSNVKKIREVTRSFLIIWNRRRQE